MEVYFELRNNLIPIMTKRNGLFYSLARNSGNAPNWSDTHF
jgi:hypothetical protein